MGHDLLPLATVPSSHTTLTARPRREVPRPIVAARPPCLMREEPVTVHRCHEAQRQAMPPSSCSWKMRQRICSSASTTREVPTRDLRGAAAARTQRGNPHGREGPHHHQVSEPAPRGVQGGHQKPGAPLADWQGSRQTSGLACQTPAASPRTSRRRAAVGGMNSLTSSCLRRIPRRSQAFF